MSSKAYVDAGDGQCLAVKDSDGERCQNGVYGSNYCCGTHKNASNVTLAPERDDKEYYYCPHCGWQPAEWERGGGPPHCSACGVEYPFDCEQFSVGDEVRGSGGSP